MTETQLDVLFYIVLSLAFLKLLDILNKAVRYFGKGARRTFSNSERVSDENECQKNLTKSCSQNKVAPYVSTDVTEHPGDSMFPAGNKLLDEYDELDHQFFAAVKKMNESAPAETSHVTVKPDLRIRDLAKPDKPVSAKRKKPMAVRVDRTRIVNVPDLLTEEAIRLIEKPAFERYPLLRFSPSPRTSPQKQRNNRREAIKAFLDDLPRTAAI